MNKEGDWEFDKDRIRHELQKRLHAYRFCPALDAELLEKAIHALPDRVNPVKDKDWKFVQAWGEESMEGTLAVTVKEYGFSEGRLMKGVAPAGVGALRKIAQRLKGRISLPS